MASTDEYAKGIDKGVFPGIQGGPLMHVIAAKAVAFKEALSPEFKSYSGAVIDNAQALASSLMANGQTIVSGGTENHVMMLDFRGKAFDGEKLTGKLAQNRLEELGITANKNTVPNDPESPFVTSGLRLGTPALTTRGLTTEAFTEIGAIIAEGLTRTENDSQLKQRIKAITDGFPLYAELSPQPVSV
jgi:glycine hydroxymethyltransferase